MANASGNTSVWNAPNFIGELFTVGNNKTPLLNLLGGMPGTNVQLVSGWEFAMSQHFAQEAASQPAITETASLTAPTPTTFVRSQESNVIQIFQEKVSVSYAKMSNAGMVSGVSLTGELQPVQDEKQFQIMANLKQIAIDFNYSMINGVYNKATNAGEANKMRGISPAMSTNTVSGSSGTLTKAMISALLKEMADNGADLMNPFIVCNSHQLSVLNDLYGYAPESVNVGGTAVRKIITPFAELGVLYDPAVVTSELLILDLGFIAPVSNPVPGKGVLFYEDLSKDGAGEVGQLYGQLGIDYGHESKHGKLTSLATS